MKVGIIGTGNFARRAPLPAVASSPGVELTAVFDVDAASAANAAETYGAKTVADSRAQLLAMPLDLLFIVSPPYTHAEVLGDVIDAGIPFVCEKPAGISSSQVSALAARADARGLLHAVDHEFRYEPRVIRLKQAIDAGYLGKLRLSALTLVGAFAVDPEIDSMRWWSFHYSKPHGGGMLPHYASHLIDLHRHLFGGLEAVAGYTPHLIDAKPQRPSTPGGAPGPMRPIDAEDSAALTARLPGGAPSTIAASFACPCMPSLTWVMHGDRGALIFDGGAGGWVGGATIRGMRLGEAGPVEIEVDDRLPEGIERGSPYYEELIKRLLQDVRQALGKSQRTGRFATLHDAAAIWKAIETWRAPVSS